MPGTATLTVPLVVIDTDHQPRERRVPCARCTRQTDNVHAVCDPCINAGASIYCHGVCVEVARAELARWGRR